MKSSKNKHAFNKTAFGSEIWADASAPPKSNNEGGILNSKTSPTLISSTDPRLVIRGESYINDIDPNGGEKYELYSKNSKLACITTPLPKIHCDPYAAITDFLNCTFPFVPTELTSLFQDLFICLGKRFSPAINRDKGLHGWKNSYQLGSTKTFFAHGGQNGTGFLSIPGEACHMVDSWPNLVNLIRDKYHGKITRWDGAVDDFEGKHTVDNAVSLYLDGKFNSGGSEPKCNQSGNWIKPSGDGRTFYVGQRENGKMLRVYEKGMQLGCKWHPWVRWEVEMHSIDRVIPWEVLLEPGKYAAGAYPNAMNWVQDEMQRIKTISKTAKIGYDALTHYLGVAYGKHLNVMLQVEGSESKVLEKLKRIGVPSRLDLPTVSKGEGR